MASPVPVSPSLFVSDDELDRSSKRSFHASFHIGPADLDSTTSTYSSRPVTPRKRRCDSNRPDYAAWANMTGDPSDETVDLSPMIPVSSVFPSIAPPVEESRLATGIAKVRLAGFTEMEREYMIAGARDLAREAKNRQQEISDNERTERYTLEDIFNAHEHLLKSAQAYHDFPNNFEVIDNFSYAIAMGDPHVEDILEVHHEIMDKATVVRKSVDALLQALNDASKAAEKIMIDRDATWDQRRAKVALEVEQHQVNLQMLEHGL